MLGDKDLKCVRRQGTCSVSGDKGFECGKGRGVCSLSFIP